MPFRRGLLRAAACCAPRPDALPALGASGDPSRASAVHGEALLAIRIAAAVAQIRAAQGR